MLQGTFACSHCRLQAYAETGMSFQCSCGERSELLSFGCVLGLGHQYTAAKPSISVRTEDGPLQFPTINSFIPDPIPGQVRCGPDGTRYRCEKFTTPDYDVHVRTETGAAFVFDVGTWDSWPVSKKVPTPAEVMTALRPTLRRFKVDEERCSVDIDHVGDEIDAVWLWINGALDFGGAVELFTAELRTIVPDCRPDWINVHVSDFDAATKQARHDAMEYRAKRGWRRW